MLSVTSDVSPADPPREPAEVLLSVEGVSKKFCRSLKRSLFYGARDILTESVGGRRGSGALRPGEFWALKDVGFRLRRGESLGLVGPNGAGKSTLLRIISGLIKPDTGAVRVRGRVAPLIALGAGFNPILTGRENIYVNMSILGLSRDEIDEKFEEVLDFAEIRDAIDAPVQTYSSGMAARLGFACAIHTSPDIFLIDEVLAVGDVKFRAKCYRRLARLRESGVSYVLVSHNPHAILSVCESSIYLSQGRLVAGGPSSEVLHRYEEELASGESERSDGSLSLPEKPAHESHGLDITYLKFRDARGDEVESPVSGEPVYFCVGCRARRRVENVSLTFLVREQLGESEWILRLSTLTDGVAFDLEAGEHEVQTRMPYCGLRPGAYIMKLNLSQGALLSLDAVESFYFTVRGQGNMSQCSFYQPRRWEVIGR
jgi:lipopolysaccharide transport system ATP-binding protein